MMTVDVEGGGLRFLYGGGFGGCFDFSLFY